jgi:hypothetical protein
MTYIQKRLAKRCANLGDVVLIDHDLSNGVDSMIISEVRPSSVISGNGMVKRKRGVGAKKSPPLDKILAQIGIKTGAKLKCKKMSPIDTSMLLTISE